MLYIIKGHRLLIEHSEIREVKCHWDSPACHEVGNLKGGNLHNRCRLERFHYPAGKSCRGPFSQILYLGPASQSFSSPLQNPTKALVNHHAQDAETGYVVNFKNRHHRYGHLFQNRYKSIVCQEDRYLMELVRYIHLNLLLTGLVSDLVILNRSPWLQVSSKYYLDLPADLDDTPISSEELTMGNEKQ